MTQIVVTLEKGADSTFLQRMIENMKGGWGTRIQKNPESSSLSKSDTWLEKLHNIKQNIDISKINMNDERTKYLMSK